MTTGVETLGYLPIKQVSPYTVWYTLGKTMLEYAIITKSYNLQCQSLSKKNPYTYNHKSRQK